MTGGRILALSLLLATAALFGGCRATSEEASNDVGAALPLAPELPPLALSDTTPNLLLTWVDAEGDFHVVEKIADIPADRRSQVRVVVTDRAEGTGQTVYVADLSAARPDGTYAVSTMSRADWEKIGADRRKARMEALAPAQGPPAEAEAKPIAEPGAPVSAIIYGADWCKPCHDAERYLKTLGVAVTKKNVEESRAAQAEMQQKLVRVNKQGSGIPVIDVMGKILVGYSPGSLKQAVEAARASHRQG
jgi:glutaredoxin